MIPELSRDCPEKTTLWRLGRDAAASSDGGEPFGDAEESKLWNHIESCEHCQKQLESFAADERHALSPIVQPHEGVASDVRIPRSNSPSSLPSIEGFRLICELGRGGRSRVYLAEEQSTTREVALKVIPIESGDSVSQRESWLSEVRASARIEHPNVVRLYRVDETSDCFLLVFEYVKGGTLRDWLDKPVSQIQIVHLVERLANAVNQIHERGVLHLDLKPSNILMDVSTGSSWETVTPRIADFGISYAFRQIRIPAKREENVRGTPAFMAPEQLLGDDSLLSAASDVYGLGAILYCLLTGRPPVTVDTSDKLIEQRFETEIAEPKTGDPTIDSELSRITSRCLNLNPHERFTSARQFAETLKEWLQKHENFSPGSGASKSKFVVAFSLVIVILYGALAFHWNDNGSIDQRVTSDAGYRAASSGRNVTSQTVLEAVTALLALKSASPETVEEASLIRQLTELPPAFDSERAAQLVVDSQRFTESLLSGEPVSMDRCLQFAALQQASGARFQEGGLTHLYATARFLLRDSIRLLTCVHRHDPGNQEVLEKLIASTFSLGLIRVDHQQNTTENVDRHVQDGLAELRRAIPLICDLKDQRQRVYWAGRLIDSFRLQYWYCRFKQNDAAAEIFLRWERESWEALASEQSTPDLLIRHQLIQPDLSAPIDFDAIDVWVLHDDRPQLLREYLFLRLADVFFRELSSKRDRHGDTSSPNWEEVLNSLEGELSSVSAGSLTIPMLVHEDLIRPLTTICTQYRAENQLDRAEHLQRRYIDLCQTMGAKYPDDADVYLAMSEAYLQAWKNALRRERPDIAVENLEKSLESAQAAVQSAPRSSRARDQVADRIKRLTRFHAARKAVSSSQ